MPYGLEAMTGVLPTVIVGGMAMKMTEQMFGGARPQSIGTAWRGDPGWHPISKKEAYNLFGKRKVDIARSNPGKEYEWGYDKLRFANGKFWLA